jgi:hypothetical protein
MGNAFHDSVNKAMQEGQGFSPISTLIEKFSWPVGLLLCVKT